MEKGERTDHHHERLGFLSKLVRRNFGAMIFLVAFSYLQNSNSPHLSPTMSLSRIRQIRVQHGNNTIVVQ